MSEEQINPMIEDITQIPTQTENVELDSIIVKVRRKYFIRGLLAGFGVFLLIGLLVFGACIGLL